MIKPRSLQIVFSLAGLGWAWLRLHRSAPQELPERLRNTLEGVGTTFIKLGHGLSLRSALFPPGYREELDRLHSQVSLSIAAPPQVVEPQGAICYQPIPVLHQILFCEHRQLLHWLVEKA